MNKALGIAMALVVVAGTSMAFTSLLTDVYAPSGRRWVPAVGDELTYQGGAFNSMMEPEYPIDYAKCAVTENTETAGMVTMKCEIYAPEGTYPQ
jgi:hypothetical protein